ncbi:MAG: hypothetical protein PHE09_12570 [Oscillospiraceae bacterium]|nr:hypothetical protein [Oscillospiraceae bacterium]
MVTIKKDAPQIEKELFEKLKTISTDDDFLLGAMSNVTCDEDIQTMIDFIDDGNDVTVSNLLALPLILEQERKDNQKSK